MINEEGFTINKDAFETINILKDLNMMLEYMNKNGARYMLVLMAESRDTKETEALVNTNLIAKDYIRVGNKLEEIIKEQISKNKCGCDECKESIETLRKKYNLGGAD